MKKTLYLVVEVDAHEDSDPMQSLSDVATWAELALNSKDVNCDVTAYSHPSHCARHLESKYASSES